SPSRRRSCCRRATSLNESVELPNYPLERTAGSPALAAAAQRYVGQTTGCHDNDESKSPRRPRWVADWRRTIMRRTCAWRATAGVLLLLTASIAQAQVLMADKVARVGLLNTTSLEQAPELSKAFRQGLRERGWVEGQNIVIEERSAAG